MIKGLQTGNAALVTAAADQMHANSADVGGNNIPVTGGTYNPDGLTVADVLSTAVAAPAVAAAAAGDPGGSAGTGGTRRGRGAAPCTTVASRTGNGGYGSSRSAPFAGCRDGAALPPHVGITADSVASGVPSSDGRWRSA